MKTSLTDSSALWSPEHLPKASFYPRDFFVATRSHKRNVAPLNDEGAVYPVTVDPISTSPLWNLSATQFGFSIMIGVPGADNITLWQYVQ